MNARRSLDARTAPQRPSLRERLTELLKQAARRRLLATLLLAAAVVWGVPAPAGAQKARTADDQSAAAPANAQPARVDAVAMIGMTVSDMDRALEFYTRVLPFAKLSDSEVTGPEYEQLTGVFGTRLRVVQLALGEERLQLMEFLAPRGRPVPVDSRSQDRWFQHIAIIVRDMDAAYRHLRTHGVRHASTGPQRLPDWNPNAGGIEAFYFLDPDGHTLEILRFPQGKGAEKWHQPTAGLFLGIDHTAIVVGDTDRSLAFYRDQLGLAVAGESENWGTEQEHLNNVFGARLRITALRAAAGPAIELLEYLTPRDGRAYPADARANDLIHWQTRLIVADPRAAARGLRTAGTTFVSPDIVELPAGSLGFARGFLVRDPDGHALEIAR